MAGARAVADILSEQAAASITYRCRTSGGVAIGTVATNTTFPLKVSGTSITEIVTAGGGLSFENGLAESASITQLDIYTGAAAADDILFRVTHSAVSLNVGDSIVYNEITITHNTAD